MKNFFKKLLLLIPYYRHKEEYRKCFKDIVYFAEHYCVFRTDQGLVTGGLTDDQKYFLKHITSDNIDGSPRNWNKNSLWCTARNVRRTSALAILILWKMIFRPGTDVAYLNKLNAFSELSDKIELILDNLPDFFGIGFRVRSDRFIGIMSDNIASKFFFRDVDQMISDNFDLIICDDFAFWKDVEIDRFFKKSYPTIAANGSSQLIVVSSPKTSDPDDPFDSFRKLWRNDNDFKFKLFSPYWVIPGRDKDYLEEMRELLCEEDFRREIDIKL